VDDQGDPVGLCVAGGSSPTGGSCNVNETWSVVGQECAPGNFCGEAPSSNSGSCYQACDPTGSLSGASPCSGSTQCYDDACDCSSDPDCNCTSGVPNSQNPCDPTIDQNCDPYFGVCE
jgi:hypothetical protein